jgi:L-glutamine:2-deoxy-scyllo-inosose/3-amino-2,3-dideoxy-scyllo-inosose aminotransferase
MSTTAASQLATEGGPKTVTLPVPAWPVVEEADAQMVADVIRSGVWSWVGPREREFCEAYAKFIGTKFCLGLANGTVTIQCALQAVGVVPGDEVIVPALTWVATAQAAMDVGANVVFADIDPVTLGLDPASFEASITPRTKAVVPVHLYGCMCDMDAILDIARRHNVKVVEDVAHQHGSQWRGKGAGSLGDAGSFSFQQSKVLTSGEGGAITCSDPDVYQTAFALKQVGWTPENPSVDPFSPLIQGKKYGHNYRITEMQAALLVCGLKRLPEQTRRREVNAQRIAAELAAQGGPLQVAPRDPRITTQAYYALTLTYDAGKAGGVPRARYLAALSAEGCGLGATYGLVYQNSLLNLADSTSPLPFRENLPQDYTTLRLPNAEKAVNETAVNMSQKHLLGSDEYVGQLVAAVGKVNDNLDRLREK